MKTISKEELQRWITEGKKFNLLDVREEWEHEGFNIGGINIPLGDITSRSNDLDKTAPIVIYCEKGIRSAIAIQRLEIRGFSELYNLQGGMYRWKMTGDN